MGTPATVPSTPLEQVPTCFNCRGGLDSDPCACGYKACLNCQDYFCPRCLVQLTPLPEEKYMLVVHTGLYHIQGTFFALTLEMLGGMCCYITVTSSQRNCRLQCKLGRSVFDVLLLRDRKPYDVTPSSLVSVPASTFELQVVYPSLQVPRLPGSACSWRMYLEMYAFVADRPEVSRLALLPNTFEDFVQEVYTIPRKAYQLWEFTCQFPKYGRFVFATEGDTSYCLQCNQAYRDLSSFAKTCVGTPILASLDDLLAAKPVSVNFEPTFRIIPDVVAIQNGIPSFKVWQTQVDRLPLSPRKISRDGPASLLTLVRFKPTLLQSVGKMLDQLLNSNYSTRRIPNFVAFELQPSTDPDFAVAAQVWLCRSIAQHLPPGLTITSELDDFQSIMYQSLHRTIMREGERKSTPLGTLATWRDLLASSP